MTHRWIRLPRLRMPVSWTFVFILTSSLLSSAHAQSPGAVDDIVNLHLKIRQQKARIEVARWELNAGTVKPPADGTPKLRELFGQVLTAALESKAVPAVEVDPDAELLKVWRKADTESIKFGRKVAEREAQYGFSFENNSPAPFKLGIFDFAIAGWTFVSFGIACLLGWHEVRVPYRRWARAGMPGGAVIQTPTAAVATLLLLGCGLLNGCQGPFQKAERPTIDALHKVAEDELKQTTAEANQLQGEVNERHEKIITAWCDFSDLVDDRKAALKARDRELVEKLRTVAVRAATQSKLIDDITTNLNVDYAKRDIKLNGLVLEAQNKSSTVSLLRTGSALSLGALALLPLWVARRNVRRQRNREAKTCPQCLSMGSLVVRRTPRNEGGYSESSYLECTAADESGNACGYQLARSHQRVTRLCFPTVGIRSSGKTHMLTTAYSAIYNRTAPSRASFQPAPSVMDERFRQYIELILRRRSEAGGTVHDTEYLPPLLVHARDVDFWGPSSVMINLFDYSGELVEETPLAQMLRPRAMNMDGFMVFFDPTQIYGAEDGKANATLEDQVRALANFYQQMADIRGLEPGTRISNPVAICISKFDLLETENPIGGECLPEILKLDGPLKPIGDEPVTLSMLKARSEVVEEMLPRIFPGVNIRRLVEEYFGTQMLFFPMSSVNLNIDEFGRVDPTSRNPVPYGVVEPILWLMHMHGYCVLDS